MFSLDKLHLNVGIKALVKLIIHEYVAYHKIITKGERRLKRNNPYIIYKLPKNGSASTWRGVGTSSAATMAVARRTRRPRRQVLDGYRKRRSPERLF